MSDYLPDGHPLKDDPELYELVAIVLILWDDIEAILEQLFIQLCGLPNAEATAIYQTNQNHRAKRELIENLATVRLKGKTDLLGDLADLMKRTQSASKRRNTIAHGSWIIPFFKKGDKTVVGEMTRESLGPGTSQKRYRKNDIRNLVADIISLGEDLIDFQTRLKKAS